MVFVLHFALMESWQLLGPAPSLQSLENDYDYAVKSTSLYIALM